MLEKAAHPCLVLDPALTILSANAPGGIWLGQAEVTGRALAEVLAARPEAEPAIAAARQAIVARQPGAVVLPAPPAAGDRALTLLTTPLFAPDGAVALLFQQLIDVPAAARSDPAWPGAPVPSPRAAGLRLAEMFAQAPGFMALLQGPEHRFELVNPTYMQLIGHRDVIGRTVAEALPDAERQGYTDLLDQVYSTGQAFSSRSARYAVQAEPGGPVRERDVDFVFQPIRDEAGAVTGIFVEGMDVTDKRLAEAALHEAEDRYRALVENVDVGICVIEMIFDDQGRPCDYLFIDANPALEQQSGLRNVIGRRMRDMSPQHEQHWFDIYGRVAVTGVPAHFEQGAAHLGGRWFDVHAVRIGDPAQARVAVLFSDITHRKREEQQAAMLSAEISHRLKNSLAVVQAIASQTLRSVPDRAVVTTFTRRLQALSAAHQLLLQQSWSSAPIREVVQSALTTLDRIERFDIAGPQIDLDPQVTLSLSLLLHELATNAMKYGALSVAEGRVAVGWRLEGAADSPDMIFEWRETGGPSVRAPDRLGFGSRLIQMGLGGVGEVAIDYPPIGVVVRIRAPLSQLQS